MIRFEWWMALVGLMWIVGGGCLLPSDQPANEDDDDAADDDASDDDTSEADDDTSEADDDTGDDDTGDDDTSEADDDTGDDDTGDDDTAASDTDIRDIQQGMVSEGATVQVDNVVITTQLAASSQGFFVQEPGIPADAAYSGIWVWASDAGILGDLGPLVVPGNSVDIEGVYEEYYDLSEIQIDEITDVVVTGTFEINAVMLDPCDIATGGALQEEYEGVLVRVANVSVTDEDLGYGEFEVANCLRVDDMFYEAAPDPGDAYQLLTGAMNYSFDEAKLEPRAASDVVPL